MQPRPVARLAPGAGSPSGPARPEACLPRGRLSQWLGLSHGPACPGARLARVCPAPRGTPSCHKRNRANKAAGWELGLDLTEDVCRLPALLGPLNKPSTTVCLVALLTQFPPPRQVAQRPLRHCSAWLCPQRQPPRPPCRGRLSLFRFGGGGWGVPEESGNQPTQVWYFIFKQASFALVSIFS